MSEARFTKGPWRTLPEEVDKSYVRVRGTVLGGRYKIANVETPVYDGVHSGQVSFPGGKMEECDKELTATALREANEETGIDSSKITILGRLTPLYIPVSDIEVTPIVGYYEGIPNFNSASREVEKLIEAPLSHFFKSDSLRKGIFPVRGKDIEISYFDYEGEVIWGATAMIFNEMLAVLRSAGFPVQV